MRKLFWGLGVCGVFVMGTTVWSSWYAARHPNSPVGRGLRAATFVASSLSPSAAFGPVVAALKHKDAPADEIQGVPDDPVPLDPSAEREAPRPVAAAPIVIPDDDDVVPAAKPIRAVKHESFGPETECPAAAVCRAPAVMPPCIDGEECEELPMPAVEEDETEEPKSEEGQEAKGDEDAACPQGHYHHQHHQPVCPYSGRSSRDCMPRTPTYDLAEPKPAEPKPGEAKPDDGSNQRSALKAIKRYNSRESIDEVGGIPAYLRIDTMEMRPSDRQLYDFGPGAL